MADFAQRLRDAVARPSDAQLGWALLGLFVIAVLLLSGRSAPEAGVVSGEQSMVVNRQPFVATVALTGTIVPGQAEDVIAPFDGAVATIAFAYGDRVAAGQVIATLDTADLALKRGEAESAYLKASRDAGEIARWGDSVEVSRARRTANAARLDLADVERRLRETEALLARGLVSRNEYDGLVQQRRAQRAQVDAADEDLGATLRRGGGIDRRIATIALSGAQAQYQDVRRQMRAAAIRAPVDGVIVRPPLIGADPGSGAIHVGMRVTRGQLIGSIAQSDGLAVAFNLDEADVNALRIGQRVSVTGAGFAAAVLNGRITNIAGEASVGGAAAAGGKARFAALARLDPLSADQAAKVRVGMSAAILITTYENPSALVVPAAAVRGSAPVASVLVRGRSGPARETPVTIGRVSPAGVEILSGLKPGDTVIWTPPPPVTAAAPVTPP